MSELNWVFLLPCLNVNKSWWWWWWRDEDVSVLLQPENATCVKTCSHTWRDMKDGPPGEETAGNGSILSIQIAWSSDTDPLTTTTSSSTSSHLLRPPPTSSSSSHKFGANSALRQSVSLILDKYLLPWASVQHRNRQQPPGASQGVSGPSPHFALLVKSLVTFHLSPPPPPFSPSWKLLCRGGVCHDRGVRARLPGPVIKLAYSPEACVTFTGRPRPK